MPFSRKNDFWIDTSKYVNFKDMKVEASLAITFAIADGDYQKAEDIAFAWIDTDRILNKLGKAHVAEQFLSEYLKFTKQATDRILQKISRKMGDKP